MIMMMVLMVMVMMFMVMFIFLDLRKQVSSGYDDIQQFFNGILSDRFGYDLRFRVQFLCNGNRILYGLSVCNIGMR